ncbi:hypothetical protein Tco_0698718 [Tanacetum coccineum]
MQCFSPQVVKHLLKTSKKDYAILLPHHGAHGNNKPHREAIGSKLTRVEAIIPTAASLISENEEPIAGEKVKRKEGREVASIEEAYYQKKLRSMGIRHAKPYTLRGGPSTKLGQRLFKAWKLNIHKKNSSISSKPDHAHIFTISGAIHGTAIISLPAFVEVNYETLESLLRDRRRQMRNNNLQTELEYFSEDYNEEREMEPRPWPYAYATPPPPATCEFCQWTAHGLPSANFDGKPPYRGMLWGIRGHQIGKETGGEGMPKVLGLRRLKRGKVKIEGESSPTFGGSLGKIANNYSNPLRISLTFIYPNPTISPAFVEANCEILESLLKEQQRQIRNEDLQIELEYFSEDYDEEREMEPRPEPRTKATLTLRLRSPGVRRQRERVVRFEDAPNREGNRRGRNAEGSFADSAGSVTPFVRWIEDYPLPDGLKMPSHIGSYDGKGDPNNFLHLFEGAIRMQKWLMLVACHMFTYTLKDSARIWWNSQKTGSILNYEDLKVKFRSHFSQQKKFTKTH